MARVSYLRPERSGARLARRPRYSYAAPARSSRRGPYIGLGIVLILVLLAAAAAVTLMTSKAKLTTDSTALARVHMPLGGGTIETVSVTNAQTNEQIPAYASGDQIWPSKRIPAHEPVAIYVVVKRPSAIAWLTGDTEQLHLTLTTPSAHLLDHFLTVSSGPLRLRFAEPVAEVSSGASPGSLHRQVFAAPQAAIALPRTAAAGSIYVAAAPRTWESSPASVVSWFPNGTATAAVANPAPGSTIKPNAPITLTFSKPVAQALHGAMPPVFPTTQGVWHTLNAHTIVFQPEGYGYGLGATVTIGLPAGVRLIGSQPSGGSAWGPWKVPAGTTSRLQQLLAELGYLPVQFSDSVAHTPAAQEAAAIHAPAGSFSWRWANIPGPLRSMWAPGTFGELTKGAIMAFENDQGMTPDGVPGPAVWNALIAAVLAGHRSTFGYTFVQVSEGSPETESTWHNGNTTASGLVNTGIPAAPTAQGVFAVFEHALSVTMSGTNPDGSHYSDPGVPWVSYFNGGDALHGFIRGGYGYPQSLGCVEMPYSEASQVYPYTPIGTIVDVT